MNNKYIIEEGLIPKGHDKKKSPFYFTYPGEKDSLVPHIHVYYFKKKMVIDDKGNPACAYIELGRPVYLSTHGSTTKILNASEIKKLDLDLHKIPASKEMQELYPDMNIWQIFVSLWESKYGKDKISKYIEYDINGNPVMPNYKDGIYQEDEYNKMLMKNIKQQLTDSTHILLEAAKMSGYTGDIFIYNKEEYDD